MYKREIMAEFDSFISLNLEKDDAEVFHRFKTAHDVWQYVCLKHHIIQDLHTPAPENKPFKLINLPFYYVGQLDRVLEHIETIPVE